jgi:Cu-Zn family superoxide dismutase
MREQQLSSIRTPASIALAAAAALAACSRDEPAASVPTPSNAAAGAAAPATPEVGGDPVRVVRTATAPMARARLRPTTGHMTSGVIELTEMPDGKLSVSVELAGLSEGRHGLHVHETGDCSAADASSAGEHFSPDDHQHGSPTDAAHHAGDLGNVTADSRGIAVTQLETTDLTLTGKYGAVDRALIVHVSEDGFTSQPSGNSGDPAACGVIELVEERAPAG